MKAGFAALSRRVEKLEADAPRTDGLIKVGKGTRGLIKAMERAAELKEQGLLPEPDPNAPPSPMRKLLMDIRAEQEMRRIRLPEFSRTEGAEPEETLKSEETRTAEKGEPPLCSREVEN